MTQIASVDLGAMAANRPAASSQGSSKGIGSFSTAVNQAAHDQRKAEQKHGRDRAQKARDEHDLGAHESKQAPKADQAQPKDEPSEKDAAVDQGAASTAPAETAPTEAPAEEQAPALDPQAVLALQLATGGMMAPPVPAAQAQTQAQTQAQAAQTPTAAEQAVQAATAPDLDPQIAAQAQAEAPKAAQPQQPAAAKPQGQALTAASLAQAARGLGPVTVQVTTQPAVASTAAQAATPAVAPDQTANLMLQLMQTQDATPAPVVAPMPQALDAEALAQTVPQLLEDSEILAAPEETSTDGPTVPLMNADRPLTESAQATETKEAPQAARPAELLPQVTRHLEQLKANQANAIKLQLYPEHLGKVEIKVISHQGVLSAQLTADNSAVKSMLESQVATLQRTFAEMGLKVDKVEVAIASSNLGFDTYGQTAQGDHQQPGRQQQQAKGTLQDNGYSQWLGDEPQDEAAYTSQDQGAAVNYVA